MKTTIIAALAALGLAVPVRAVTIAEMTPYSTFDGTDVMEIQIDGSTSNKISLTQIIGFTVDTLSTVATTGSYSDLADLPTLGTAAATDAADYATDTQGGKADSALQPEDINTFAKIDAIVADVSLLNTTLADAAYQAKDPDLLLYAAITPSANVQSLLGAADYAAIRALLDLEAGTDVQTQNAHLEDLADGSLSGSKVGPGIDGENISDDTIDDDSLDLTDITLADFTDDVGYATTSAVATGYQPLDADLTDLADGSLTGSKVGSGISADNITTGTLPDARIAESGVTQHEGSISITESQISDLGSYAPTADPVFTGSAQIPNGAAPTTDAFGEIAGDNNAWAASRGAPQWYDGTANTYLLGSLASDTPTNGQVPKWNTGGTITWEDDSTGAGIADGGTLSIGLTFPIAGLHILDTDASHDLIVSPGSNLTADRTLTVTTGDADRALTISGNTTLGGGSHSGTNTGDQTITLTGDVTGSGTGSFAATIGNGAVTLAKMANIDGTAAEVVLGRSTASSGVPELLATTGTRGTPVMLGTSPTVTTSILTGSTSFTAFAGATTLFTIGGTGASASNFFPSTLDATSSTTGAIRTSGGFSAAKAGNIGTVLTVGTSINVAGVSVPTISSTSSLSNKTLVSPVFTEAAIAALDINWATATTFTKTLSANSTFTFSNVVTGKTINVALTNTASNYTVTWPTVSWAGGTPPTQTVGAKTDVYTFIRIGSTTYGSVVQNF